VDDDMVILPSDAIDFVISEHRSASVIVSRDSYERALVNTGTLIVRKDARGVGVLKEMLRIGMDKKHAHKGKLLSQCTQSDGCFSEQDALRAVILSRRFPDWSIAVVAQRLINTFARPQRHLSAGVLQRNNDKPEVVWGVGSPMGQCTGLEPGRVRETCLNVLLDVAAEATHVADVQSDIIRYAAGAGAVHRWWTAASVPSRLRARLRRRWEVLFRDNAEVARKVRNIPDNRPKPLTGFSWRPSRPSRSHVNTNERCRRLRSAHHRLASGSSTRAPRYRGIGPFSKGVPAPWGYSLLPDEPVSLVWGDAQECLDDSTWSCPDSLEQSQWWPWFTSDDDTMPDLGELQELVIVARRNASHVHPSAQAEAMPPLSDVNASLGVFGTDLLADYTRVRARKATASRNRSECINRLTPPTFTTLGSRDSSF